MVKTCDVIDHLHTLGDLPGEVDYKKQVACPCGTEIASRPCKIRSQDFSGDKVHINNSGTGEHSGTDELSGTALNIFVSVIKEHRQIEVTC